jgi:hypothetical protein
MTKARPCEGRAPGAASESVDSLRNSSSGRATATPRDVWLRQVRADKKLGIRAVRSAAAIAKFLDKHTLEGRAKLPDLDFALGEPAAAFLAMLSSRGHLLHVATDSYDRMKFRALIRNRLVAVGTSP